MKLRVNGIDRIVDVDAHTSLIYVLRNDLGLKAAKVGCDAARQCGACAVLCDGKEVPSCSLSISEVGDREITTAEGIETRQGPTPLQRAFFDEQASQCGYCIPGMIVAATALLNTNPDPTEDDIKAGLDRHICRCGTHARIIRAVKRAASWPSELSPDTWPKLITSIPPPATYPEVSECAKPLAATLSAAWLRIDSTGQVTAYSGKVDMGTGLRTALIQIVADELDVEIERVTLIMADTALTPDQGKSTASCGVAVGGQPLRVAACEARAELIRRASESFALPVDTLDARDGFVFVKTQPQRSIAFAKLASIAPIAVPLQVVTATHWGPQLSGPTPSKPRSRYQYVGKSVKRDVVAEHILGTFNYVHNVTLPGMLHGRVVLPPEYFAKLIAIDEASIANLPGVQIVRRGSFLGVVAEREEIAVEAARRLRAEWTHSEPLYDECIQFEQMRRAPVVAVQTGFEAGSVSATLAQAAEVFEADFHFGYQLHAMIGPSCAVANVRGGTATIWSGSQSPNPDRLDIANMLALPAENVRLIYREAAGSYGRLGCDDAAADAALMSQIVGRPVRVQWSRRDEHGWAPVGTAMSMKVKAVLANGNLTALDYTQWSSTHASAERGHHVAWRRLGSAPGNNRLEGYLHGLHYEIENKRGVTHFLEPTLRTIYLRGPGSLQSHFAIEQAMDELAARAGSDPIEFRLRYLAPRDQAVLRAAARLARWQPSDVSAPRRAEKTWMLGRGVAYTRSGLRPTCVAVIIDLRVDCTNGRIVIDSVFLAHECGYMVNPDGVLNQVQGNIIHALSRALFEEAHYSRTAITTLDWDSYNVIRFRSIPRLEVELMQRPDQEPAGVGETSSIPIIAAVANAIYDATGVRMRVGPFTAERVLGALNNQQ